MVKHYTMNIKETYTKIFLKQANIAVNELTVKEYLPLWWQNTRVKNEGGLRLTEAGYDFLTETLQIEMHDVNFPPDFEQTTQTLIFLDNFIDCPYYLTRNKLIVSDQKKAVELHLFSGDIRKYGIMKAMKRQESLAKNG